LKIHLISPSDLLRIAKAVEWPSDDSMAQVFYIRAWKQVESQVFAYPGSPFDIWNNMPEEIQVLFAPEVGAAFVGLRNVLGAVVQLIDGLENFLGIGPYKVLYPDLKKKIGIDESLFGPVKSESKWIPVEPGENLYFSLYNTLGLIYIDLKGRFEKL
jgi:hypothetical protein